MLPCQFHCFSSRNGKPYRSVLKILQTCSRIACAAPVVGIIELNSVLPSSVGWICQGQDPNPGTPPVCLPLASPWGCCRHLQSWVDQASRSTYPQERMNYFEKRNTEARVTQSPHSKTLLCCHNNQEVFFFCLLSLESHWTTASGMGWKKWLQCSVKGAALNKITILAKRLPSEELCKYLNNS